MGFTYEVIVKGDQRTVPIHSIFHVWDGNESETPSAIADVFENDYLPDLIASQVDALTWTEIEVLPLDITNPNNPLIRTVSEQGAIATDDMPTGVHAWVKFISDDNGFKSGGKLVPGLAEANVDFGALTTSLVNQLTAVFEALVVDLVTAGLSLAIYRPTLSTPGFPQISTVSEILVRGLGTNNRRQRPFQN